MSQLINEQGAKRDLPDSARAETEHLEPLKNTKLLSEAAHLQISQEKITSTGNPEFDKKPEEEAKNYAENIENPIELPSGMSLRPKYGKQQYSQLKFNGITYKVGDYILIRETKKTNMVAQLKAIIAQGGDIEHPRRQMIEVKWYYKKEDLEVPGLSPAERASLGENEVFDTKVVSKVYADLLNGKCRVWSLKEYDGKPGLGNDDYYMRASYNIEKVLFFSSYLRLVIENTGSATGEVGKTLQL